ncbi:Preprotein translocase subunit SecY [Salinivibrio costicola]|uniref:Preprotein translocase subunit SecY n=1 Tax=Salinivibrio costicola TaxID=51367 RepID=A0ABX6K877_SALCS|nr:Preprotein translocase subunit SecY [Salinivibrio costicola]QIR06336.1 Preprotein translocase subunit SecY [Salinivibrio costicola]
MSAPTKMALRFPKGRFAMLSVYSFTGAAIVASTIFSLLLFLSLDDNPLMQWLFGALAVIFEAGKFYAWYEFGERRAHGNYVGALSALAFYLILALISIGGSIGGINSATNAAQSEQRQAQAQIDAYNRQIDAIEQQITLNNQAAERYIELDRIATGVARLQKENNQLRKEQQQLAFERDSLPAVAQGSILGLISNLANTLGISADQAQSWLVIFLSVLLDLFAAFFVGVIGEEQRFRHWYRHPHAAPPTPVNTKESPRANEKNAESTTPDSASPQEDTDAPYADIKAALAAKTLRCSKKAVMAEYALSQEAVDALFTHLQQQGLVAKKPNHHYHWVG